MIKIKNNNIYVCMYHYVQDKNKSSFPNLNSLPLSIFRNQLDFFKKNFNVLNLEDFKQIIDTKKIPKKPSILLTFDDGYKDHYENVFPLLVEKKMTGIFYGPVKTIENKIVLDVNKIHIILSLEKNRKKLILLISKYLKNLFNKNLNQFSNKKLLRPTVWENNETHLIKGLLQYLLPEKIRLKIIDKLFLDIVKSKESVVSKLYYLNKKNVKEMIKNGMYFGSHGNYHKYWEKLSYKEQKLEIDISSKFYQGLGVDKSNFSVCYPYGSYNKNTLKILHKEKINFAFRDEYGLINKENIKKKFEYLRVDTNYFKL